jgi:molybdopterin-guanine dinucleotide biosynthesis protein A
MNPEQQHITGVILAGGMARRMDNIDKGLLEFAGKRMVEHVIERLSPQVGELIISANRNQSQYASGGYPVVSDSIDDYAGPLAGILAAMKIATTDCLLVCPCDAPLLSTTLARRLLEQAGTSCRPCIPHDGERLQPLFALLPTNLIDSLQGFLAAGQHKVTDWIMTTDPHIVDCTDIHDSFININTEQELERLKEKHRATQ